MGISCAGGAGSRVLAAPPTGRHGACCPAVAVVSHGGKNLYSASVVVPQSRGALKSRIRHRMMITKMRTVKKTRLGVHITGRGLGPAATHTVAATTSTVTGRQENGFSHTPTKAALHPASRYSSLTPPFSHRETRPCFSNTFLNYRGSSYLQKVNNTLILLPEDRS